MKFITSIILLSLCLGCIAQKGAAVIKFCPLSLIDDPSFPTLQAGIEYNLTDEIAWYNELGIQYRKSYYEKADTDSSFVGSGGFKIKSEIRYYVDPRAWKNDRNYYLGFNIFFIKTITIPQ